VLIAWGSILALGWLHPVELIITHWRFFEIHNADPVLWRWDAISWPYAFALGSLGLAVIFTAPARFKQTSNPQTWAANLAFISLGLIANLAATPLSLIVSWTILDLVELAFVLGSISDWRNRREAVTAFTARLLGTSLMLAAMIAARSFGQPMTFENMQSGQALLVLGAVVFRLGIVPLNLGYVHQLPYQHGLMTTLRMVGVVTALVVLARIPVNLLPDTITPFVVTLLAISTLYGALVWCVAKDEINGRPYWFLTFGGLAILSTQQGYGQTSIVWGLSMVISGGALFLFSTRSRKLLFLPILGLVGFSGLPFTPTSTGWQAFSNSGLWMGFLILILTLLMMGYLRHALRPGEPIGELEGWGQALYSFGLFVLLVSGWITGFVGQPTQLVLGNWWAPSILIFLVIAGSLLVWRGGVALQSGRERTRWLVVVVIRVGEWLGDFLQFGWLFKFFDTLFNGLQRLVFLITDLLEGQGGVLWALLLLALLLTILGAGGGA
jgi:hypothetical protein